MFLPNHEIVPAFSINMVLPGFQHHPVLAFRVIAPSSPLLQGLSTILQIFIDFVHGLEGATMTQHYRETSRSDSGVVLTEHRQHLSRCFPYWTQTDLFNLREGELISEQNNLLHQHQYTELISTVTFVLISNSPIFSQVNPFKLNSNFALPSSGGKVSFYQSTHFC